MEVTELFLLLVLLIGCGMGLRVALVVGGLEILVLNTLGAGSLVFWIGQ